MTVNQRRPIPIRTDSIGPWLQAIVSFAYSFRSALTGIITTECAIVAIGSN